MKNCFIIILLAAISVAVFGQENMHQTIRGTVVDAVTGYCLVGANVILLDSDPLIGTITDMNGQFTLQMVPLGRQGIEVRYMGYKTRIM